MEQMDPSLRAYFELGLTHYNRGDYLKASEQWRLVLQHDPTSVQAHKYLALTYEKLGWKHKAKKQWQEYLKLEKDPVAKSMVEKRLLRL